MMECRNSSSRPRAVFMAFGTQGDVYPIAALSVAFAIDQDEYDVVFITHVAHKNLKANLEAKNVAWHPVSTPPVLSANQERECAAVASTGNSFYGHKKVIQMQHRQECLSEIERVFGNCPSMEADFILINFFALEGWNLAELFRVQCVIASPYVVPYSSPASFERQFKKELPELYKYLNGAPLNKTNWRDVMHWMWPLFTEEWGSWRHDCLKLSTFPLTDPITCLPVYSPQNESPLLLYGFSKEIVECPGYWPCNVHVCGFWFLPSEWQFSCRECREISSVSRGLCLSHSDLQCFLEQRSSCSPIFIGLSSAGSMGFLQNPRAFLLVLKAVSESTDYKFILFSAGYKYLEATIELYMGSSSSSLEVQRSRDGALLFNKKLFCFFGSIPYSWIFPKCAVAIHHGGSGSTAAALRAGIPQIVCPFLLDQFYWAERICWLGVAPEPLQRKILIPDSCDDMIIERAAEALKKSIASALLPRIKERALEISDRISTEDGIQDALKVLKESVIYRKLY